MNINVYAIYDSAADAYMTPFFMHTHALAIRAFQSSAMDGSSLMRTFPEQFTLCQVGFWADDTGRVYATEDDDGTKQVVYTGKELKTFLEDHQA